MRQYVPLFPTSSRLYETRRCDAQGILPTRDTSGVPGVDRCRAIGQTLGCSGRGIEKDQAQACGVNRTQEFISSEPGRAVPMWNRRYAFAVDRPAFLAPYAALSSSLVQVLDWWLRSIIVPKVTQAVVLTIRSATTLLTMFEQRQGGFVHRCPA
jgi:hypothetical protein